MKRRYKVLPLDQIYEQEKELFPDEWESCFYRKVEIPPVFRRAGWYYDRLERVSWIELEGRAWRDDRIDDFLYRLSLNDHQPLASVEREAIETLMKRNMCPKELRRRLWIDDQVNHLRRIKVDMFVRVLKYEKENPS